MDDDVKKELDIVHSGIMALEEILIKKNLVSREELNEAVKKASEESKISREQGKSPSLTEDNS